MKYALPSSDYHVIVKKSESWSETSSCWTGRNVNSFGWYVEMFRSFIFSTSHMSHDSTAIFSDNFHFISNCFLVCIRKSDVGSAKKKLFPIHIQVGYIFDTLYNCVTKSDESKMKSIQKFNLSTSIHSIHSQLTRLSNVTEIFFVLIVTIFFLGKRKTHSSWKVINLSDVHSKNS